jgi:hypothetical protein
MTTRARTDQWAGGPSMRRPIRRAASLRPCRGSGIATLTPSRRMAAANGRDFRPDRRRVHWRFLHARLRLAQCRSESRQADRFHAGRPGWGYRHCRFRAPPHCRGSRDQAAIRRCPFPSAFRNRREETRSRPGSAIPPPFDLASRRSHSGIEILGASEKTQRARRMSGRRSPTGRSLDWQRSKALPAPRSAPLRPSPGRRPRIAHDRRPPRTEGQADCPSRGHRPPGRSTRPRSARRRGRSSPESERGAIHGRRRTRDAQPAERPRWES